MIRIILLCVVGVLLPAQTFISRSSAGDVSFTVGVVADNLDVVWDIEVLPDGRVATLHKRGEVHMIIDGQYQPEIYHQVAPLYARGQGGLLDMSADPSFLRNGYIYVVYTVQSRNQVVTRLSRFTDTGEGWEDEQILYDANPVGREKHFGSRVVVGDDGHLYMTLGERGEKDRAQNLDSLHGKILRFTREGSIPVDNPFVASAGVLTEIYSFGHRNPQGLAVHPETGQLYSSEHGPSGYDAPGGGDEINIILPGRNYGWPIIHHSLQRRGMVTPMIEFTPATAPSGISFYSSMQVPAWKNSLFIANLRGASLQRIELDGSEVVSYETLLEGQFGRIRTVSAMPDGTLLVSTSNGDVSGGKIDRILRISPADSQ